MNAHYNFTAQGYQARLIVGWTTLIAALLAAAFHPPTGLALLVVGGSLLGATYYARRQNEAACLPDGEHDERRSGICDRIDQAREYRTLFEEGIISLKEYHNSVAGLYPELNREILERSGPTTELSH